MATVKVHAPNSAFTGVVAGVVFKDGVGEADRKADAGALSYFARKGYGIGTKPKADPEPAPERPVDAREATSQSVGTPLRDAAVDPKPEDFLAPINAGKGDPHGPTVVSPEIHHPGPKGIKPGDVHVGEPAEQEKDEKALATAVLIERQPHADANAEAVGAPTEQPAQSSSQKTWAAWAISQGADPAEAEAATRKELIERYGGEG